MNLLAEINERGTTVLVVTHNKEIVNSMKKRVVTMHEGVIVSDGKKKEDIMRPSTIWFTLKQGVKNIKRNWMFSIASILTMAACIFLVGIFYSIVNNVDHIAHKVEQEVPITVFFDEGTTQEQIDAIGEQIRQRPEVQEIVFTSADDAWNEFKDQYFQGSEAARRGSGTTTRL